MRRALVAVCLIGGWLGCGPVAESTHASGQVPNAVPSQHVARRLNPEGLYVARGIDPIDGTLFVEDVVNHELRQSDDWGATFSGDKGFPPGTASVDKILRFGGKLYALARRTDRSGVGIYAASPAPGDASFRWSGPTLTIRPPAVTLPTGFNAGSHYMYVGEYGDPKPGPRVYRTVDGRHWQNVFGPELGMRHIHGIAADPYRPHDVWMTTGDGTSAIWNSTRDGARGTWRDLQPNSSWQSVQISFTRDRIFFAADTHSNTFFIYDRAAHRFQIGTPEYFQSLHPPGSPPPTRYLWNAYFGAVDPKTGTYYCVANDDSGLRKGRAGTWQGFFIVPHVGAQIEIADPGGDAISMNGEVLIGGGRVFSGQWWIPTRA